MTFLQVGDVFTSRTFGENRMVHKTKFVDRKEPDGTAIHELVLDQEHPITIGHGTEHGYFQTVTRPDGFSKKTSETLNVSAHDESRGDAKFVVEQTAMTGGGTGHGPHDVYPDGWQVTARRLTDEGNYDPNGESVYFYQSGSFTNLVKDVEICTEKFALSMIQK